MSVERLALFDIDGTLLRADGAGRAAMKAALERVYGTAGPIGDYRFGGRTDRYTIRTLLEAAGLSARLIWSRLPEAIACMEAEMRQRLTEGRHNIRPCPGAKELVARLAAHDEVLLGLLTGNFPATAALKLRAAGFDPTLFKVGVYGDASEERADLPLLAVEQAVRLTGIRFRGQQIVIIGDTPADVVCGRNVGARSIAVLTGWSTREELEAAGAHYIFEDLTDTEAVLEAIFAPEGAA